LRLLSEDDKAAALLDMCRQLRAEGRNELVFEVEPQAFDAVPGKPFAYWVSEAVRESFSVFPSVDMSAIVTSGTGTLDDFRFLRSAWELRKGDKWFPFAKGGSFFADVLRPTFTC